MPRGSDGGRDYSLVEVFAIIFVLADVLIVAALLFAGPLYAIALAAVFVFGGILLWALGDRTAGDEPDRTTAAERDAAAAETDPVTTLQERYAAGELSEAEFEAKLERLIEANERADAADVETDELSLERSD
jgi:uncharacterized membrane protein